MADQTGKPADPQPATPRAPRWMRVTLVMSLALNLLIIGAIIGAASTGGGKWRSGGHGDRFGGPLTRAFSEEDQRVLKRRMAMAAISERDTWGAHRSAMKNLAQALRKTPYDAEAVRQEMNNVRDLLGQRFNSAQNVLTDHIAKMSDAERSVLADRLEQELRRRRR
ncbi:periplasmic heavy metal sensor [Roseovarius rhodophyticola]|uniref:Periplasmic heavy metal sensor n=1 Tax=Roseovarius rhodophyticola TaxID=3080827 RepID=A0ABZ2TGX1_9RHOB|nr:periplasmic heavy metal sensor [Roseovarius sp. W115]MDV2929248.1 periplasmic heavy metal sensor [Roseovarius sp. W115]